MIQNVEGLKFYISWIKNTSIKETRRIGCLNVLKNIEALPFLIDLLDISYQKEIQIEPFETLNSIVINALYNIALVSENNFINVKENLEKFMQENIDKYKNVNYLLHSCMV